MDEKDKEYRELLLEIAQEVTNEELATMKFLMPTDLDCFPDNSSENFGNKVLIDALDFFRNLEKKNQLGVGNLGELIYLLEKAKRSDLALKVNEFHSRRLQSEVSNCASSWTPAETSQHQQDGGSCTEEDNVHGQKADADASKEELSKTKRRNKKKKYRQKKKAEKISGSTSKHGISNVSLPKTDEIEETAAKRKGHEKREEVMHQSFHSVTDFSAKPQNKDEELPKNTSTNKKGLETEKTDINAENKTLTSQQKDENVPSSLPKPKDNEEFTEDTRPGTKEDEMARETLETTKKEEVLHKDKKECNNFPQNSTKFKTSSKSLGNHDSKPQRQILSLCTKWQGWGESAPVINREFCLGLARAGHRVACLVLTSSELDKEEARKGNVELIQCSEKPGINKDDPQLLNLQQLPFCPDFIIGYGKLTGPTGVFHAEKSSCPRVHVIYDLPNECAKFDQVPSSQQCNEEELARSADFVAVIGTLLKEKWSSLLNREVIEIVPGLPDLTKRNRISSPQCRCFVPAKFRSPVASGLRIAVMAVNNSSKREIWPRKSTLVVCNTDSSGSLKPTRKVLKAVDHNHVDLNERINGNSQEAYIDIRGATMFLSPARMEAFGVAALDAIAIGIPIVISAHSGLAYTIRQYFDEKFHSCIEHVSLECEGVNDDDEEENDARIWAIQVDKITLDHDRAFSLADELSSEWKKSFTWDGAVQHFMDILTKSGKLPSRSLTQSSASNVLRSTQESYVKLVEEINLFDKRLKFVLFLSPERPEVMYNMFHLGLVHWAAVFDFNRESAVSGYLKSCEGPLENSGRPACRVLPPPKEDIVKAHDSFTLPNGIPWVLLQGLPEMKRDICGNLDWIQEIFKQLKKRHPSQIMLLIIWNSNSDNEALCKKLYQLQLQVQASPALKNEVKLAILSTSENIDSRLNDIAEEWGVNIKKVDINKLCDAIYSTATSNPLYQLDTDFSLPKRNSNGGQDDIVTSATLPSSIRWVDSVLEVLYMAIGNIPEYGKEDAHYFYRGGKISWYGIEMKYAVERESWGPLKNVIKGEMEYPGAAYLRLYHQRGTGGTTSARKLLYDFHHRYPCVCLKTVNHETSLSIKAIWEFCCLPVIILADINEFPGAEDSDIAALYGNLSNEGVSCLLMHVIHRHYQERNQESSEKETVHLAKPLIEDERDQFVKVYSLQSPANKAELNKMRHEDEELQIPFYYGLVAFEEQFKGLRPFVSDCLQGLNDCQRNALCFLSMAYYYAQLDLPLREFAAIFNLKPRQLNSIYDILTPESTDLLIEEDGRWRPRHYTIGKEILRQLLTVPYDIHAENWQRNLADMTIEFVSYMDEETTKAVLLNRIADEKTYKRFSSLVEDIPEGDDVIRIFEKAISCYPSEPFLKAHLGRYYSVRRGVHGFEKGLRYTDESVLLASDMSKNIRGQLTQMKRMIYRRQVRNQIDRNADYKDIFQLADEGMKAFTSAASICPETLEKFYIPLVRMMCDVFWYINKTFSGGIFNYLQSSGAHKFILDSISETGDILESVSDSPDYPDLRRDLFRLRGHTAGRSENKADLIKHFRELKKTSKTSTASINRQIVLLQLELFKEKGKPITGITEELSQLLEEALKYDNKIDLTMRLWVRVAPHIPVDLQAAESKITAWCNKGKSALAYLYRYIITCIRILDGGRDQRFEDDRKIARDELRKAVLSTKRLSLIHPDRPVVFLGTAKGMGQLVTVEESVTNVRKQRWISESFARRLRMLTGIITKTGKVGQIKTNGLTVSFRADLCHHPLTGDSYLSRKVRFYLAFTYFEADAYNVKLVAE